MPAEPCEYLSCNGGNLFVSLQVVDELNSILILPVAPFFVVMINAPLAALIPYKAVAAGPFNTVIDSISLGFISMPLLLGIVPPVKFELAALTLGVTDVGS